jgi:predicted phage terminase large subunit-like protein
MDIPNKCGVILIQTRWHLEDPAGRTMRGDLGEPYQVQLARAQNEAGDSLWPERFPPDELAIIRARGEYDWWSLYQQEPRPRGTELFREPARYDLAAWLADLEPHMWRWAIALDPAASEETHADHSVALLLAVRGYGDDAEARVVDLERGQWEVPALCERVKRMRARWVSRGVTCKVHIEGVGGFKAVGQVLRGMMPHEAVVPAKVSGDKFTRALPVSAVWNTKRLFVPSDAPWADRLISECVRFTGIGDAEDDQVDALAYAWRALEQTRPQLSSQYRTPLRIHSMG